MILELDPNRNEISFPSVALGKSKAQLGGSIATKLAFTCPTCTSSQLNLLQQRGVSQMTDVLTENPDHVQFDAKFYEDNPTLRTFRDLVAKHFAAQFNVPVESVTITPYSDDVELVCAGNRIWANYDYQDAPSDDKTYLDVSDLTQNTSFVIHWSDDERAALDKA